MPPTQQMLEHKGGQTKNWGGECRDDTSTKLQCQNIHCRYFTKKIFYNNYKKINMQKFKAPSCYSYQDNSSRDIMITNFQSPNMQREIIRKKTK